MNVFINYRRDDTQWQAKELHNQLSELIPRKSIFIDIDSIPIGADFKEEILSWISECDVFLVLIGKHWIVDHDASAGTNRLHDQDDLVRIEIESALAMDIPVVSVFVDGAEPPQAACLPQSLSRLVGKNGVSLNMNSFKTDVSTLHDKMSAAPQSLDRSDSLEQPTSQTASISPPLTDIQPSDEKTHLVLRFLNDWPTWGFTPKRILTWGSQQVGFAELEIISRGELDRILQSLLTQNAIRTRISKNGNTLYQAL